jgi:FkbM family methyltransferase
MIAKIIRKAFQISFFLVCCRNGVYRHKRGALRGLSFRISRINDISLEFVSGKWEGNHFEFISRLRDSGIIPKERAVICDIGANVGLYSAWFDRLYAGNCLTYAFEPSPAVVPLLSETLELNHVHSVTIVRQAVADKRGTITFFTGTHHSTGSIFPVPQNRTGSIVVETISLDEFFFNGLPRPLPHFIKIDIEGAGTLAFPGGNRVFREAEPIVLMDCHSTDEDAAVGRFLKQNGWSAFRLNTGKWVENLDATAPVENGVWGTMALCPPGKISRMDRCLAAGYSSI